MMQRDLKKKRVELWLGGFLVVFLIGAFFAIYYLTKKPADAAADRLPVFQPHDVNAALVDSTVQHVKKYHTIADFKLVNQNGDTITQQNYAGKIYVADFFFTTCPTICPVMTENMRVIQDAIAKDDKVMLLSHSVIPEQDSVPVLNAYAKNRGVNAKKWNLVTGDKKQIYNLARKSYLAVQTVGDGGPYDMIHTENFILVDPEKRIRGFYDGTNPVEIEQLIADIKKLEKE